jgi:hypothetical protein
MRILNLRTAAVALVAGLGLAGCAYGPYGGLGVGVGYGNGYGAYGYPYGGYGSYGYGSYGGYGYGSPYYGWYDGFYYPGTGYYVYDRYRRPHRWSDNQRSYWERRREYFRTHRGANGTNAVRVVTTPQWGDFNRNVETRTVRVRNGNDRVRVRTVQRQSATDDTDRQHRRGNRHRARND